MRRALTSPSVAREALPDVGASRLTLRAPRLALCGLLLLSLTDCTTSKAVRAWHEAEAARASGDRALALQRYQVAFERDGNQYGAEVARLSLLALDPSATARVTAGHEALLVRRAGTVEVELLGVGLDLVAGRTGQAQARLASISDLAIEQAEARLRGAKARPEPCGGVRREVARLRLEAAVQAQGSGAGPARLDAAALQTARDLQQRCGAGLRPREALLIGVLLLQAGEQDRIAAWLESAPPTSPDAQRLRASIALRRGDPSGALVALVGLDDAPAAILRAAAHVALRAGSDAMAAIAAAHQSGASAAALLPLEAAAALLVDEPKRARDLLAGLVAQGGASLSWIAAFDLGLCELMLGDPAAAIEAFAHASRICPSCSAPRRNLQALRAAIGG